MTDKTETILPAAEIVAAYVGNNKIAVSDLPTLIRSVHAAIENVGAPATVEEPAIAKATAAQIRKSITPDTLISFEDGKPYKTLKRHLSTMGLTIDQYKAKWGLPKEYPTVAPSYSEARSAMAKSLGLGRGRRGGTTGGSKRSTKKA